MEVLKSLFRPNFFSTGLAMFAMFFGSGNLIFPVGIGRIAGEETIWALMGLFLTAVFLPFATLCLMLLFNGDYNAFFSKVGVIPGKIVAFCALLLIGPFGVLPRCIAFAHSTFSLDFPSVSLFSFSLVTCILVFLLSLKKSRVVGILGNFLTPILLISLCVIIYNGFQSGLRGPEISEDSTLAMIKFGFVEGYKTFDIFAALFFASAIMPAFYSVLGHDKDSKKRLMTLAIRSSLVGMALLFLVYAGLSFVAARLGGLLTDVPGDKLLATIARLTMGQSAGLMANLAVAFACLTTAITLALVSADFMRKEVFAQKIPYVWCLVLTMAISLQMSLLGFSGIMTFVLPFLMIMCPAVITLVITNALNLIWKFPYIKSPVYLVFIISLMFTLWV